MVSNGPRQHTVIRAQARKSLSLSLFITDRREVPLDITNATFRIVVRKNVRSTAVDDSDNLITNSVAVLPAPIAGLARFNLQASDLDFAAGEYLLTIVMVYKGFSTTIINGTLELEENAEFSSVGSTYTDLDGSTALAVVLENGQAIKVETGPTLAPGQALFTNDMERRLLEIYAGVRAAGQAFTADDIADGVNRVLMTTAERVKLANFVLNWTDIQGKPAFGDIITHNQAEFLKKLQVTGNDITSGKIAAARLPIVMAHEGATFSPNVPSGGVPGGLHFQYTE